ncbi:MAG: hypothetical protein ACFFER_15665 [Candidatus Thorarchaeota archaeon]
MKGLSGRTHIGLLALLKKGQIDSYSRLGIEMYDLARKVDGLPKEVKEKCRISTNQLAHINKVGSILQPIFDLLGLEAALKNDTDQKRAEMLVKELLQTIEEGNIHSIQFRTQLANYLEMYKEAVKYAPSLLREKKIDVGTIETFAEDFFIIFRHYMNLVIRFFKYDCQQYWLQEIPESAGGYFYFTNEIFMDNKGPLIPIARHHHASDMLSEEYLISENDWLGIRETIGNYEQLVQRAGDFTLGGIFSQSDIQLEEDHLENAVILGLVGLEAAMTQTLEYFYGEKGADGTAGKKLGRVRHLLKKANFANMTPGEFDSMYRLIAGTDNETEADGLLPLRNEVMHNGRTIPKGDKRIVVEYISAGRRFAYRLINWIKSTPDKTIAPYLKRKNVELDQGLDSDSLNRQLMNLLSQSVKS